MSNINEARVSHAVLSAYVLIVSNAGVRTASNICIVLSYRMIVSDMPKAIDIPRKNVISEVMMAFMG
jgi:hypothetical protein